MKKHYLLSILCLFLFSFSAFGKENKEPIPLTQKWILIQMSGFTKEKITQKGIYLDWTNKKSPTIFTGCNELPLMIQVSKKGKFSVKDNFSPENECEEEEAKLENQLLEHLKEAKSYILHGKYLVVQTQTNKELIFVASE